MTREELKEYIRNSSIFGSWHWYEYHFNFLNVGREHPFAKSIIDSCMVVESKIPGYSKRMIDHIASINGRNRYLPHYDQLKQILAELLVVSHLASQYPDAEFEDEPSIGNSKKNPEITIKTDNYVVGVEVKSPKLREHVEQRATRAVQLPGRMPIAGQMIEQAGGKDNVTLPRDNPVKDFLISADEKFAGFKKEFESFYGILVIVWDDHIYEPITSIISEHSGLFTANSFAKDKEGKALIFKNIDAVIVIRQLHIFVEAAAERPLIDGKKNALDYGAADQFPFKVIIPNPNGEEIPLEIRDSFHAVETSHKLGAEYMPQEYIMWIGQP
ncbi:MAG: hypothetical protein WD071_00215 [Pseudohongiella sp.]|uniref:hypothetical protein n=1 Tax=Pseudohongiella sp. TaxID=1979412 RepID=UPI0034A02BDA